MSKRDGIPEMAWRRARLLDLWPQGAALDIGGVLDLYPASRRPSESAARNDLAALVNGGAITRQSGAEADGAMRWLRPASHRGPKASCGELREHMRTVLRMAPAPMTVPQIQARLAWSGVFAPASTVRSALREGIEQGWCRRLDGDTIPHEWVANTDWKPEAGQRGMDRLPSTGAHKSFITPEVRIADRERLADILDDRTKPVWRHWRELLEAACWSPERLRDVLHAGIVGLSIRQHPTNKARFGLAHRINAMEPAGARSSMSREWTR